MISIIDTLKPLGNFFAVMAEDVGVGELSLEAVLHASELELTKKASKEYVNEQIAAIPKVTKTSQLQNDSGFLTQHQDLSAYAKKSEIPSVPTKLSQLQNDAEYAKISDIPTPVTKTSQLVNDSGYLTKHQDLSDYAKKSEIPTIPSKISAFQNDVGYLTEHQNINGKADNSTVDALSVRVTDTEAEQATLSARMDELVTREPVTDDEWADARVGVDKSYASIGGAIRGQVSDIKNDIKGAFVTEGTSFEKGGFDLSGKPSPAANRVRTKIFKFVGTGYILTIPETVKARIIYYSEDSEDSYIKMSDWQIGGTINIENGYYTKLLIGYSNDAAISDVKFFNLNVVYKTTNLEKNVYTFKGEISLLGYNSVSEITEMGMYSSRSSTTSSLPDIPFGITGAFILMVNRWSTADDTYSESVQQTIITRNSKIYSRYISNGVVAIDWETDTMTYSGDITLNNFENLADCIDVGTYSGRSAAASLPDAPVGLSGAFTMLVSKWFDAYHNNYGYSQILFAFNGRMYRRYLARDKSVAYDWETLNSNGVDMTGLNVAVIGDSISTNGNEGTDKNVPEITIEEADVGKTLSAYLTYHDVQNGLTLGGHTFTQSEIGTEVTFTPVYADIGKSIGVPSNYNPNSTTVWWEVAQRELGFNTIPVCWSGSSITSHENDNSQYKTAHAWHEAQIRKCGIRKPGTMERIAPDAIIIYRGTNDFSHAPYTKLTNGLFDGLDFTYPTDDTIQSGFGYKEGLVLTIKKLRDAYPNAKIFLCTLNIFKRVNYSHFPVNNGLNTLPQYNNAIREVANYMGCGIIEFDKDGITFENCYSQGYITDSAVIPTHPSDKGHKVMGNKAISDLRAKFSKMN